MDASKFYLQTLKESEDSEELYFNTLLSKLDSKDLAVLMGIVKTISFGIINEDEYQDSVGFKIFYILSQELEKRLSH